MVATHAGGSAAGGEDEGSDEEAAPEPATFATLPTEVVACVLASLDPLSLARAACVCSQWRACAAEGRLWAPLLERTFPQPRRARLLRRARAALAARRGGGSSGGICSRGASSAAPTVAGRESETSAGPALAPSSDAAHMVAFAIGAQSE